VVVDDTSVTARASPKSATLTRPHVLGLHVAVDHVRAVRRGEGLEDGLGDREGLTDGQRTLVREPSTQVGPCDVLHGQVAGLAVDTLVEHPDQTGVTQARCRTRLTPEPGDEVTSATPVRQVRVHNLQRDLAVQAPVDGEVDGRHPAPGDPGQHLVPTVDHMADQRIREGGCHGGSLRSLPGAAGQGHANRAMSVWTLAT
jgi:hypothetical protein